MKRKFSFLRAIGITAVFLFAVTMTYSQPGSGGCRAHFWHQGNPNNNDVDFSTGFNPSGTTYAWDFGDGSTGSQQNETHTYAQASTYYVCLTITVTDANGTVTCTDTECDSVRVGPPPPPAPHCDARYFVHHQRNSDTLEFDGGGHNAPGTSYDWDFGDNSTGTGNPANHLYSAPGTYYACLTVTSIDSTGTILCTATWCDSVRVGQNPPPPPPPSGCNAHYRWMRPANNDTLFFGTHHNGPNATFDWDFGDGSTGTGQFTNHLFANPGTYYVCLTVTNTDSTGTVVCTDTWCDSVNTSGHFGGHQGGPCPGPHGPHHFQHSPTQSNSTDMQQTIERILGPGTSIGGGILTATVYPNPVDNNSVILIQNATGRMILRIYGSNGTLIDEKEYYSAEDYQIADKHLGAGIYFYQVADEESAVKGKFIIK